MANYAMVIDLHKCVTCGSCGIGCKKENNVPQEFYWANFISKTTGKFPNVQYKSLPTLCNHCADAPCVDACPVQAMYKDEQGITRHDSDKCIGCKACMVADPYGVIYFNKEKPHKIWRNGEELIADCTATGKATAQKVGEEIPYYNPDRAKTYAGIRPKGVVEKCTFCDHRVSEGKLPYCVEVCPADARIFGDLDDPNSKINYLLDKYDSFRLREDLGTEPKVIYIRDY